MKGIIIIFSLMLTGCLDIEDNNHGYGYEIDFVTPMGIEYRHDSGIVHLTAVEIDQALIETMECTGLYLGYHDVMVVVSNNYAQLDIHNAFGMFVHSPNLIIVYGGIYTSANAFAIRILKHEFIHYLQRMKSINGDHGDMYFTACGL